jgi:hypothetical protein
MSVPVVRAVFGWGLRSSTTSLPDLRRADTS